MHALDKRLRHILGLRAERTRVLACLALLALAMLCGLTGCKETNVVKNVIHDQSAEKVDTGTDTKQRVVASDGVFTAEDTGLYERAGKGVEALPVNVVYASKDPETELPVPKFVYDSGSKNSSEATESVSVAPEPPQEQEDDEDGKDDRKQDKKTESRKSKSSKGDKGKSKTGSDGKSKSKGDGSAKDGGDGTGDNSKKPSGTNPAGSGGDDDEPKVYDATGKDPEIPDVGSVAAYGQVAVIVQMLGGQDDATPLVAADDELMNGAFSTVFADEGSDRVNANGWEATGDGSYEPDVDEIIDAKPDTVLVFSDSMFTKKEKAKLAKEKVSITVVPSLVSDASTMRAVETVAKMLDKETDGLTTERYEEYKSYHDSLVSDVESGHGGYGAYNNEVYDANMTPKPRRVNARKFTLLIDEWDYSASFSYKSTITDAGAGVGLSRVGYMLSPVSYYIGVAGVVNSSAAIDTTRHSSGKLVPAWQFNPSSVKPSKIDFGSSAFSSRLYSNWGDGFTKATLVKPDTGKNDLAANGFGSDKFPKVIVANQKMKKAFIKSSENPYGLYHAFGMDNAGAGQFHGVNAGGTQVFTTIDPDADMEKSVLVNPHGLFSSWVEGSAEAVLECAWIASIDEFENDWGGSVESEIERFYKKFYRYPSIKDAEVRSILDGLEG